MATSKSPSKQTKFIAGASVFSGRPDPTWPVDAEFAARLQQLWNSLPSYGGSLPAAPPLGYRGCFLRDEIGAQWFAYRGVVKFTSLPHSETRTDQDRQFERLLFSSAPTGLIPPQLVADEFD